MRRSNSDTGAKPDVLESGPSRVMGFTAPVLLSCSGIFLPWSRYAQVQSNATTLIVGLLSACLAAWGPLLYRRGVIRDIVERKRADERLRRATRASLVLSASNQAVIRSGDEDRLLRDICDAITNSGGYPLAWVGFADRDAEKRVRIVAASGTSLEYVNSLAVTWDESPSGCGPSGTAIRSGRVAMCNVAATDPAFAPWRERAALFGHKSLVALPLRCEQIVIGALTIYASEEDAYDPEEIRLLEELAANLSYGLEARRHTQKQAQAEAALQQSAAEFRTLFNTASDAILIADSAGRLMEVNQAACQRLGYTRDELLSMTIPQIDSSEFAATAPMKLAQLFANGEGLIESVHRRKDGSEFPVEINNRVFRHRGQDAILCVVRDVSEHKLAEKEARERRLELERAKTEAEDANRAKSEFLANMSHEIRTPMHGIIGMQMLALTAKKDEDARGYIEAAQHSAQSLLAILNDILDLSKIEAGQMEINPIPFSLRAVVRDTTNLLRPKALEKGLFIGCTVADQIPDVLVADALRLRQVLINLVGNAIKFTEHGRVELLVDARPAESESVQLDVAVVDSGIGVPAEKQNAIFEAFQQADSSTTRQYGGTGLGLTISARLAAMMGGSIALRSVPGQGSTFRLTLPCQLAPDGCEVALIPSVSNAFTDIAFPVTRPLRVLLVEDNAVNQRVAGRLLKKGGHQVVIVGDGVQALEAIKNHVPFDLILMDVQMPVMDGLETTRAIRNLTDARRKDVPIVAMTAFAMKGDSDRCLAAGMNGYISKPFDALELSSALERFATTPAAPTS